ncbi:MAG: phosphoribosylamine--glycine ligase [Acidimicrobiia bacterium]|nr:phosphoribosylamine--glycine ligase [Acidimicrobiia bacterium]MDH3462597.1 phosphoribosylamine--glycine ligase [Acidimicrobiia bacterium]
MKVLLIGSGAREHALGWKIASSPRVRELISLPGNPGLAELGSTVEGISLTDIGAVAAMAQIQNVDLVVVGPEAPLAAGIVDVLARLGIPVFGPTRAAARLEASKTYAKTVMARAGVPTAGSASFTDPAQAVAHLGRMVGPYVVKADGLAAGKGVLVTGSQSDAITWAKACFDGRFGEAGSSVLIEEYLEGPEVSVFAACTPAGATAFSPARDYKRLLDGDDGPNTGGMGAFSPIPDLPDGFAESVMDTVVEPTRALMAEEGVPFNGFLYAGLVLTAEGPKVLEFNVRLGDPETQAVIPRLSNDLIDVLEGSEPEWSPQAAVNVVLAAPGYPGGPEIGAKVKGLRDVPDDVLIFQGGTRSEGKKLFVDGGRVLSVVGRGATIAEARERAFLGVDAISWPGMQMRTDIALV